MNPSNNFTINICLLGQLNKKEKFVYYGYGIAFYEAGSWIFGNEFTKNIVIFDVDNSLSRHEIHKKSFLVLVQGPTDEFDYNVGKLEKKIALQWWWKQSICQ